MREILFWVIGFPFVFAFILGFMSYSLRELTSPSSNDEAEGSIPQQ